MDTAVMTAFRSADNQKTWLAGGFIFSGWSLKRLAIRWQDELV